MKPEKITIEVIRWSCSNPEHRHRTQEVAQRCIDTKSKPKRETNIWTKENLKSILADRRSGMTYKKIGEKWRGISAQQAACVVYRAEHREQGGKYYLGKGKWVVDTEW